MFFFWSPTFFILYSKIACFKNSIVCTLMETSALQRTYIIKKTGFTLYSCFRLFIQIHLLFQLSGITQIFQIPTFQKLV